MITESSIRKKKTKMETNGNDLGNFQVEVLEITLMISSGVDGNDLDNFRFRLDGNGWK